jgi:aryl-alcohol dehydrogenase-like predicted oxidoreductase
MQYRQLGASGFNVSAIAFGAWQIGDAGYWGQTSWQDIQATVDTALDAGVNLFDTAEMYGNGDSERALGKALGPRRDSVFVATKVWPDRCAPAGLRIACENSLKRLGTDRIDLYQVHWPVRDVPVADVREALERLRQEGKIRATGVSNFGVQDLSDWLAEGACVSNQLGYNLLFRAIEWEILPDCHAQHIGVVAYMPLMQGLLTGRWASVADIPVQRRRTRHFSSAREGTRHGEAGCERETFQAIEGIRSVADRLGESMATVALSWLLHRPGVASVVVGGRRPEQVTRNLAAAGLALDQASIDELDQTTDWLKMHFGVNADMWQSSESSRIR